MAGMKPWERSIIEYRPNIGFDRTILSVVDKSEYIAKFKPSKVVDKTTKVLGIDMIERLLATLSKGTQLLNEIETSLGNNSTFNQYKQLAKDDTIEAHHLYMNELDNIDGNPLFDVYPIIVERLDEMEDYLDYINDELFEGRVEYSDTKPIREEEEQQILSWLEIESQDLRPVTKDSLTDEQRSLVQKMIDNPYHPLTSMDDYLDYINKDMTDNGSHRLDYDKITNRVQVIATINEKTQFFQDFVDKVDSYIHISLSDHVYNDLQGSLEYMVDLVDSLDGMKNGLQLSFDYQKKQAKEAYTNMLRVADRDVRVFLDKQLSQVRKQKEEYTRNLSKYFKPDKYAQDGAQSLMFELKDSTDSVEGLWKYVVVEHIGTSEMNRDQDERLFDFLHHKQKTRSLYHYVDLVDKEFDRANEEKEIQRFISIHKLHQKR